MLREMTCIVILLGGVMKGLWGVVSTDACGTC